MKKGMLLIFGIVVGLMSFVFAFSVDFEDPTPADGVSDTTIVVNVSADVTGDSYAFVDWNYTNVLFMAMDYNSSTTVYDNSSYGNDGTATNAYQSSGKFGDGYYFDGASDYINIADPADGSLDFGTGDATISVWFYQENNSATQYLFDKDFAGGNVGGWQIILGTSQTISFRIKNGATYKTSSVGSAYNLDEWNHLVILVDRDGIGKIYINGVYNSDSDDISDAVSWDQDSTQPLRIGSVTYGGSYFNGSIDDITIFKRILKDSEIDALYNYTANKYYTDLSSFAEVDNTYSYSAYLINSSGKYNSTELRTFIFLRGIISIDSPANSSRNYLSGIDLNITTNFDASCIWSNDSFLTNYTMTTVSRNFNAANVLLPEKATTIDFFCNDSTGGVTSQINFTIVDHLIYYVDNSSATCSDSYTKNYATNESTPFCNINSGALSSGVSAGDEIVIKYRGGVGYCEGINPREVNVDGTADSPIIVRGENNTARTFLNGTCAPPGVGSRQYDDGIYIQGEDFWTFKYLEIYNFSVDSISLSGTSLNLTFENITINLAGYAQTPGAGDGITLHDDSTAIGRWINTTGHYKSGLIDTMDSKSYYYDVYVNDSNQYGVFFSGISHGLYRAVLENNAFGCIGSSGVNFTAENITCKSSGGIGLYQLAANHYSAFNITNFGISETPGAAKGAVRAYNYSSMILMDGAFDDIIRAEINSFIILINVTYSSTETILDVSNLTRKWYLDSSSNVANTNITVMNSSGDVVYSDLVTSIPRQTLIEYINVGGTRINYSNYTIIASASGYVTNTTEFNLTDNVNLDFTLVAIPAAIAEEEPSTSGGGGIPKYYPTESDLQDGYSKQLYGNWEIRFKSDGESHSLKLNSFNYPNETATITISSEPQMKTLSVGEEWKVNLNNDSYYDLLVRLDNVTLTKANVFIQEINVSISVGETEDVVGVDEVEVEVVGGDCLGGISCWFYVVGGIILVLVLIGVVGLLVILGCRKCAG